MGFYTCRCNRCRNRDLLQHATINLSLIFWWLLRFEHAELLGASSPAATSSVCSSFMANCEEIIEKPSMTLFGFHLCLCIVGVSIYLFFCKNQSFPPLVSWTEFTSTTISSLPRILHKKERKHKDCVEDRRTPGGAQCQACVWRRNLDKEGCGFRVCICARVRLSKGEASIILFFTAGRAGALLWHATRLHFISSNHNRTPPGLHESSQAQPGRKPQTLRWNSSFGGGDSLRATNCTLLPTATMPWAWNRSAFYISGNSVNTRRLGWGGQDHWVYTAEWKEAFDLRM